PTEISPGLPMATYKRWNWWLCQMASGPSAIATRASSWLVATSTVTMLPPSQATKARRPSRSRSKPYGPATAIGTCPTCEKGEALLLGYQHATGLWTSRNRHQVAQVFSIDDLDGAQGG